MALVGHLPTPVSALRGPDERCLRSSGDSRLRAGDQRWPDRRTLPVARALALAVLLEQVQRPAARVDEDSTEVGLRGRDDRSLGGRDDRSLAFGGLRRRREQDSDDRERPEGRCDGDDPGTANVTLGERFMVCLLLCV